MLRKENTSENKIPGKVRVLVITTTERNEWIICSMAESLWLRLSQDNLDLGKSMHILKSVLDSAIEV